MDNRDLEVTMLLMGASASHVEETKAQIGAQIEESFSRVEEEQRRENAFRMMSRALQDIQNR